MDPRGLFDPELIPSAWFDPELTPAAWFDRDFVGEVENAVVVALSADIVSGGNQATTVQLAPPAGKTTGEFLDGRISDDTNPLFLLDISLNKYTELEWCVQAVGTVVVNGDVIEFRVTKLGVPLDTYTVTPQWTIGVPAISVYLDLDRDTRPAVRSRRRPSRDDELYRVGAAAAAPTIPDSSSLSADAVRLTRVVTLPY